MKPSPSRIERLLAKVEAALVPPPRKWLRVIIDEGDDEAEAKEKAKALAEHVARHPEDAGLTVKDFRWIAREIVQWPRPNPMPAEEISAAEISAAAARDEITKSKIEDEFISLNECKGTDGSSETPEPVDPDRPVHSRPWRPVHQRPRVSTPCSGELENRMILTGFGRGRWRS